MANDVAYGNSCDDDEDESDDDLEGSNQDYETDSFMFGSAATSSMEIAGLSLGDSLKSVSKSIDQSQNINDKKETSADPDDDKDYDTIDSSYENDWDIIGLLVSLLLCIILLV